MDGEGTRSREQGRELRRKPSDFLFKPNYGIKKINKELYSLRKVVLETVTMGQGATEAVHRQPGQKYEVKLLL